MNNTDLPVQTCINCENQLNTNSCVDSAAMQPQPRTNDLTICLFCGQPYYFNEQLQLQAISERVYRAMPAREKDILKEAWKIRYELLQAAKKEMKKNLF